MAAPTWALHDEGGRAPCCMKDLELAQVGLQKDLELAQVGLRKDLELAALKASKDSEVVQVRANEVGQHANRLSVVTSILCPQAKADAALVIAFSSDRAARRNRAYIDSLVAQEDARQQLRELRGQVSSKHPGRLRQLFFFLHFSLFSGLGWRREGRGKGGLRETWSCALATAPGFVVNSMLNE